MASIEILEQLVRQKYEKKDPDRDRWSDWMYENHVLDVADYADKLARRFNASPSVCRAAALLHDIADAEMPRGPLSDQTSILIAGRLLQEANFSQADSGDILKDALPFHSCHGDERPKTFVGQILATADALSHINSEFYPYFHSALSNERTEAEARQSARDRLIRDYEKKIAFDEIREEVKDRYKQLLAQFG